MAKAYFLTEDDHSTLMTMLALFKANKLNIRLRGNSHPDRPGVSPECYIAYPQTADGIPPLDAGGTYGEIPGSAECNIYQMVRDPEGNMILEAIDNFSQIVYNISPLPVSQEWLQVQRDKFGNWLAVTASGRVCDTVRFIVVSEESATRSVLANVNAVPSGFSLYDVPDLILPTELLHICDSAGCYFNETPGALVGREGWAKYMTPVSPTVCQPGFDTGTSSGSNPASDDFEPQWEVFALCCATTECDT